MDQKAILKQMIDFNRAAFENSFNAMTPGEKKMQRIENNGWHTFLSTKLGNLAAFPLR